MPRCYKQPRARKELWDEPKFIGALFIAAAFVVFFFARINGWHVTEKDVICTKGGNAYVTVFQKVWRSENMDYACKKEIK